MHQDQCPSSWFIGLVVLWNFSQDEMAQLFLGIPVNNLFD